MTTVTASAVSKNSDTAVAASQAVRDATARLNGNGNQVTFGFVFVSPGRDLRAALASASQAAGCSQIIGCTTAGEITESGLVHEGVAVLLVSSPTSAARIAFAQRLKADAEGVARKLSSTVGELRRQVSSREARHLTTVLLTDGLSGTGERLVAELFDRGQGGAQIVGGAAGDEGKFKTTHVGAAESASSDSAAAVHVFSTSPWGVGVNHGLRSTTKQMRVTKAVGNVIHELDGEPAFRVYARHAAARGIELTPENAAPYLIGNELGIHFFDRIIRARAPLAVGSDGSLSCAAEVPQGSLVSILDGETKSMVEAARIAALEAKERLGSSEAAGVLLFDCVCRGMILKDDFHREIDAVRSIFGDVPTAGFLTYGEIARYRGRLDGWHNATAVVVAIPK
jgi:methyl-accepting chemotaxis protein